MQPLKQAASLLQDTETKLRGLVSEAAASGDYASVVQIAAWARTVSELVKGSANESKYPPTAQNNRERSNGGAIRKIATKNGSSRHAQRSYPQFFRQGDQLIRLAWSKRERKEYRHKAPLDAVKALAKVMAEKGADGRVFSTDQILPITDTGNAEVPNYQAYVGISLFKQIGIIDQHGRQGYSIPHLAEFRNTVEAVWKKLPEMQNS